MMLENPNLVLFELLVISPIISRRSSNSCKLDCSSQLLLFIKKISFKCKWPEWPLLSHSNKFQLSQTHSEKPHHTTCQFNRKIIFLCFESQGTTGSITNTQTPYTSFCYKTHHQTNKSLTPTRSKKTKHNPKMRSKHQ